MDRLSLKLCAACGLALSWTVPVYAADATPSIEFHDGTITPSQLEVPANTRLKIEIHNTGKSASEFESHRLHKEMVVPAGQTVHVEVHPLAPGKYDFFDDFHEDAPKGVIIAK
jgi:heme/copper-type cytochrome/quinol oxidase subunit 2